MNIAKKSLLGALVTSAVAIFLTAIIIATLSFQTADEVIRQQSQDRLVALREAQKSSIEAYLGQIKKQILTESNSTFATDAALVFRSAFQTFTSRGVEPETMKSELATFYQNEFGKKYSDKNPDLSLSPSGLLNGISDRAVMLQYYFIQNNPNPLGEKDALYELPININYSRAHAKYHPRFREFLQAFEYYDIFLIDAKTGQIIYSVFKELDYATSLLDGPYSDSGLADVFKEMRYAKDKNAVAYSAFRSYTPSYEDPAAFIASPVQNEEGENIAVLAFQMPIDAINNMMTHNQEWSKKGLGASGETYLVGEDFKAQSISRFLIDDKENYLKALVDSGVSDSDIKVIENKETNIGFQEIKTKGSVAALNGESGFDIFPDYRDVPVLSAYTAIEFVGSRIALMVEIDEAEAFAFEGEMITSSAIATIICSLIVLAIVALLVWQFTKSLSLQLGSAISIAQAVARGDEADIVGQDRDDEIGELMSALDQMQTELIGELARREREALRIKMALDVCDTNIMMADADYQIIYMNQSMTQMMIEAESDLHKDLPNLDARNLLEQNIDVFHKNPAHQRNVLDSLVDVYRVKISVGGRTFSLTATPIFDDDKQRVGTVVEWDDQTLEVNTQNELDEIIQAANDGNLSKRISMEGKDGFFATMSGGLNSLLDKTSAFVGDLGNVLEAMSEGDLTHSIDTEYKGEFDRIKSNANNSIAKLSEVLFNIQSASGTVRASASEVTKGADDLSRRTEAQASSLEETASSMEEMTATVKQTSDNATQANNLAVEAKAQAQIGGEVVENAVAAMSEILDSSNKINDIIGVIDEIAFQTNLLALNAAVEAARAGEQGRGFAVVAGEVRTLSQRSAAAAKEIKDLIRDSVGKVESGSQLVNKSGATLAEIVSAVEKVASMIEDVNTAATEQNSGIGQINQAINHMDEMTQQNAALVEETSAASRSMSEEASKMSNMIAFFKMNRTNHTVATPVINSPEPSQTYDAPSSSSDDEWDEF